MESDQVPNTSEQKDIIPTAQSNEPAVSVPQQVDPIIESKGHGPLPKDQRTIDASSAKDLETPKITVLDASAARTENDKAINMVMQESSIKITHDTRPIVYEDESFGKSGLRKIKCEGKYYKVDYHPLGPDITPFSEPAPESSDIMPISTRPQAINHENSTVYSYSIPDIGLRKLEDGTAIKNISYQQHIPAVAVLHSNIHGAPVEPNEVPIVMSLSPSFTSSYIHDVQSKFHNGAIDLRYVISMGDKHKEKEVYNLGHIWVPLTKPSICWVLSPSNWDHANIKISPAFAELYNLKMNSHKDMVALTNAFRFADSVPQEITHSILSALRRVADVQLGLSRLYWRLWVLYMETALNESMLQDTVASDIVHAILPREISSATHLNELMNKVEAGIQPFFVTEPMMEFVHGIDLINILYVALSHSFAMNHTYGITECLPGLGSICMIVPKGMLSSIKSMIKLTSNDIYYVLRMFGYFTNQTQLIEEIGRTVSCFLVRPEGDRAWLGHDIISMELPYFKCAKTIMFLWKLDCEQQLYEVKARSIYKLSWVGMVRYMMISLAANAVLSEMGLFTVLQLEALNIRIPKVWYDQCINVISARGACNKFNALILRFGLRCNWGVIMNKMLYSTRIVHAQSTNFIRLLQWSDWLIMNRELIEGTFMAGTMCHVRFTEIPELGVDYVPNMLSVANDDADIYYRMSIRDVCPITLHVANARGKSAYMEYINPIIATNGLPLDGQFRRLDFLRHLRTWFTFSCTSREALYEIAHEWTARREYYWELTSKRNFKYQGSDRMPEDFIEVSVDNFMPINGELLADREPTLDISDLLAHYDDEDTQTDAIIFGSPQTSAVYDDFSMHSCYETGRVPQREYDEQVYPIHYCDSERKPTVGQRVWLHGFEYSTNRCGTKYQRLSSILQHNRTGQREIPQFIQRHPKQLLRRRRHQRERQTRVYQPSDLNTEEPGTKVFMADTKPQTEFLDSQPAVNYDEQPGVRLPVERTFFPGLKSTIESLVAYAKAVGAHDLKNDPLVVQTDCLTNLLDIAPGAAEGMRNRIVNFLYAIDELDLNKLVSNLPLAIRGEYCRTFHNVMIAISKNIPNTNTHSELYRKIVSWFYYASTYLQSCPAMTEAELKEAGIRYDANVMNAVGFRDIRGEIDILKCLTRKVEQPDEIKQEISQSINSVKKRILAEPEVTPLFQKPPGQHVVTSPTPSMPASHTVPVTSQDQGASVANVDATEASPQSQSQKQQPISSEVGTSASHAPHTESISLQEDSKTTQSVLVTQKKLLRSIGIKKE